MSMFFDVALKGSDSMYLPWNEFTPFAGVGSHGFDAHKSHMKHLLLIVEDIITQTTSSIIDVPGGLGAKLKTLEYATQTGFTGVIGPFASTITNLSREITSKPTEDEDDKTKRILKALANHSWKAKVVLALAAFTVKYGKLRLLTLLYTSNPLARSLALLKQQTDVPENSKELMSWYKALAKLIKAMLDLTKCILEFKDSEPQVISTEKPDVLKADIRIPTAVCWTINSATVCYSQIMGVLVMRNKYLTLSEWTLDDFAKKLDVLCHELSKHQIPAQEHVDERSRQNLQKSLGQPERAWASSLSWLQRLCMLTDPPVQSERHTMSYSKICSNPKNHVLFSNLEDENSCAEAYEAIVNLFNTSMSNNLHILEALFDHQDQPLFNGSTKERVSVEVLKAKTVLLLISDLDLCHEELLKIDEMYMESRQHIMSPNSHYEIVWLPMVDRSMTWTEKRNRFETVQSWMPWHSVHYPSLINPGAIRYIHEVWQFNGKPLLVVLDSQGNVVNNNAIHMIRIWGSQAFPFSHLWEKTLWTNRSCIIELLLDTVHPLISEMIEEDKHICIYGGEDMEWIQRFTTTAQRIAGAESIPLELLYTGKSCPTDLVQSNIKTIVSKNLSHVLQDVNLIKFFWLRLESIVQSRLSAVNSTENDPLTQDIKILLEFDKDGKEWALIARKESILMAQANGEVILKSFIDFDQWKDNIAGTGLVPALRDYFDKQQNTQKSSNPNSPEASTRVPARISGNSLWRSLSCFADGTKIKNQ